MNLSRVRPIAGVLIRRTLRSPGEIAMLVIVPLVAAFVFGLADQRANDSLPVGLVRAPSGALAHDLATQLRAEPELRVRDFEDATSMESAIRRGDVYAGVEIPDNYDQLVDDGRAPAVDLVGDGTQSTFVAARAAVALVIDRESQTIALARRSSGERSASIASAIPAARRVAAATPVVVEKHTARGLTRETGLARSVAGMLVFFVFTTSMGHAITFVGDRRRGVFGRMATTRARDAEIVTGEILGQFAICVFQGALIVAAGTVLFSARWGDLRAVGVVVVLFATVSSSMTVIVGRFVDDEERVGWVGDGLLAVLGVLGGCFFSLRLVPGWLRVVGHVAPHAWAVDAFERLGATSGGIAAVELPLLMLTGFAVTCFLLAVRQLRHSLEAG